ncbi:MAG: hypothetical protein M1826_003680 [Phylliscum demangeonii]|nr:MAG: hypothetical protein M1826_003680 [Phylliscum demangeonii]
MPKPKLALRYAYRFMPKELFLINCGRTISLRVKKRSPHSGSSFDVVVTAANTVQPQPKRLLKYPGTSDATPHALFRRGGPNGASMRPNTFYQQLLSKQVLRKKGSVIYSVPAGTRVPDDLMLALVRTNHYALQPAVEMPLPDLNAKITDFLNAHGSVLPPVVWREKYPPPAEPVVR